MNTINNSDKVVLSKTDTNYNTFQSLAVLSEQIDENSKYDNVLSGGFDLNLLKKFNSKNSNKKNKFEIKTINNQLYVFKNNVLLRKLYN